jgi:hypothetical protein
MNGLNLLVGKIPTGGTRLKLGVVTTVNGQRMVNVDGNLLAPHSWSDPMVVDDGDPVDVEFFSAGVGGSRIRVAGRSTAQPRHRTATVTSVPASSPTISVRAGGITYPAEPVGGPYAVGDLVHLDWGAGNPRAIGKVTLTAAPPVPVVSAPPAPPPPQPVKGKLSAAARSSRTYWPGGGWGSYAGDGAKVHQGTWGQATVTGAWFYGTPFKVLAGRRITRIQFRTGHHLGVGASGPKTFHFYVHTHPTQPGGDTNRVVGPFSITIPQGAAPRWIDLPTSFAAALIAGGGIAMAGEPYAAMQGRTSSSPDSGSLIFHWER